MSTAAAPSPPAARRRGQSSALVSNDDERPHAGRERRTGAGTQCATEVGGADFGTELQCGVDCGGVGLLEICGEAVANQRPAARGRWQPRKATSGGDTHRGGVFVEGGHRALPATATLAEEGRDLGAVESVGRYGSRRR